MMYFDDMQRKYGFNDGATTPQGVEQYREVYLTALNRLLAEYHSTTRVIAYNRPGMHNWCLIARVTATFFATLTPSHILGGAVDWTDHQGEIDCAYDAALADAHEMDLDDYVTVEVHINHDGLEDLLAVVLDDTHEEMP